jgi:hypothetical protein
VSAKWKQALAIGSLIFFGASIGFSLGLAWSMTLGSDIATIKGELDLVQRVQTYQHEALTLDLERSTAKIIKTRVEQCSL